MNNYTGDEHFTFEGMPTNNLLSDFWHWLSSDLLNNTIRGILAEYIVANALDIDTSNTRQWWNPYDLDCDGLSIEIKSSAYIQSWNEDGKISTPIFGIAPTYSRDNTAIAVRSRKAAIYVFCLLTCKDRQTADPLKLEQWTFYVVPTHILNERCGEQKTLTLGSLLSLNPDIANYENLKATVIKNAQNC